MSAALTQHLGRYDVLQTPHPSSSQFLRRSTPIFSTRGVQLQPGSQSHSKRFVVGFVCSFFFFFGLAWYELAGHVAKLGAYI